MLRSNQNPRPQDGFLKQSKSSEILPSPATLESYEEICPGIVEKLVGMAEKGQLHRHQLEEKIAKNKALALHYAGIMQKIVAVLSSAFILVLSLFLAQKSIALAIICCVVSHAFIFWKSLKSSDSSNDRKKFENNGSYQKNNNYKRKFSSKSFVMDRRKSFRPKS